MRWLCTQTPEFSSPLVCKTLYRIEFTFDDKLNLKSYKVEEQDICL